MRWLIGALCAAACLLGATPNVANAATVACGRVTTFVAPNAAGSLNNDDGWVSFAKSDGSSEKVILRAGTQVGTLSGYICVASEGVYLTEVLSPGAAGYIPEPVERIIPGTGAHCGTVAVNPFTSGQISGPRTFQLRGGLSAFAEGIFRAPTSVALPTIGSYLCGQFEPGAPSMLLTVLRAGDPGYVAEGLPNTSTASSDTLPGLALGGFGILAGLALLGVRPRRRSSFPS